MAKEMVTPAHPYDFNPAFRNARIAT